MSGTAWVSGSAASIGRGDGVEGHPVHRDQRARADVEPGARGQAEHRGRGVGQQQQRQPDEPDGTGPGAAQRAGQRRVAAGVGDERDRHHRGAQRQRGEQSGEHPRRTARVEAAARRASTIRIRVTPQPLAVAARTVAPVAVRSRPTRASGASTTRARTTVSSTWTAVTSRPRGRRPPRSWGAQAGDPPTGLRQAPGEPEGEEQGREHQRARGEAQLAALGEQQQAAREDDGVAQGLPPAGSRVWTTTSARPSPARAAAPTARDAAPARPSSGSAPARPARGRRASRETTSPLSQEEAAEAAARAGTRRYRAVPAPRSGGRPLAGTRSARALTRCGRATGRRRTGCRGVRRRRSRRAEAAASTAAASAARTAGVAAPLGGCPGGC